MDKHSLKSTVVLILATSCLLMGQGKPYQGPEDSAGDIAAEREGYMTGNRVLFIFVIQQSSLTGQG